MAHHRSTSPSMEGVAPLGPASANPSPSRGARLNRFSPDTASTDPPRCTLKPSPRFGTVVQYRLSTIVGTATSRCRTYRPITARDASVAPFRPAPHATSVGSTDPPTAHLPGPVWCWYVLRP